MIDSEKVADRGYILTDLEAVTTLVIALVAVTQKTRSAHDHR